MNRSPTLAFDRGSVRTLDVDGRLHISVTNISKANVCPYLGSEIPGWVELGLQPDRVYRLLRCPLELAAGASSFNNLPILDVHMPVDAYNEGSHQPDIIIGSVGTDAQFSAPYLQNSAVIWSRSAIDDIDRATRGDPRGKREWSCAYRYTPDMTPGNFEGLQYDGVMRTIIGNHVALVKEGRAGPDVMIGDWSMKSRMGLFLSGALVGLVTPKLAADATVDLTPLLDDITADNLPARAGKLAVAVTAQVTPHLATDQSLDVEDVVAIIASAQANPLASDAEPPAPAAADGDPPAEDADPDDDDEEKARKAAAKKKAEDDAAAAGPAEDADPDAAADCPTMDSATVAGMIADAVGRERARAAAIATARTEVAPHIGQVTGAADSAADIYKLALDGAGVATAGVPKSAYRHMVAMLPKPGDTGAATALMASDAVAQSSFGKRFPTARAPSKVI